MLALCRASSVDDFRADENYRMNVLIGHFKPRTGGLGSHVFCCRRSFRAFPPPLLWSIVTLVFLNSAAICQTDTLTIQQAIDTAETQNLNIAIARSALRKSDSRLRETQSSRYPALSFKSHYLYTPVPGYNEIVTNGGEYGLQLSAGLPLYDAGVRSALMDQAAGDVERSQVNVLRAKVDIAFSVRLAYYESIRARRDVEIHEESVSRLRDYGLFLKGLQQGGIASESDVLKGRVDLNNEVIALESARRTYADSKIQLNRIMGRPLDAPLEIVPADPSDSLLIPPFSADENPAYRLLQHDEAFASYDLSIARSERLPTLSIVADGGALGVKPGEFRHDLGYSVSLSLEMPLFMWGGIGDRVEQKESARDQIRMQLDLERRDLEAEWRTATAQLDLARKNLAAYGVNIHDAEDNYLSAKSRFAGGTGSNLEVLEAHRLLTETKLNYNTTLFQLRSIRSNLLQLAGKL